MRLKGVKLELVKEFKFTGLTASARGEIEIDVSHRLNEGARKMRG